jgi:hypothetical protein
VTTAERTRLAFERRTPDRVPVHAWLGLTLIEELSPPGQTTLERFQDWIDDPLGSIVRIQRELGLDPMITTYNQHVGELEVWARMLFPRPFETETWVETYTVAAEPDGHRFFHRIRTPDGDLDYSYLTQKRLGTSCDDYLLDGDEPERKLAALRHYPAPALYDMSVVASMAEEVGEEAWWLHAALGPWELASEVRGLVALSTDIYDRPEFVHELMRFCTDWLKGFYRRLGETGIDSIAMDETWVGVGIAPVHYREFIQPYETELVAEAHEAGYLVSYHDCGRATLLLEDIVSTGADALETLTSNRSSGDVDLADAKRRVGDRICLMGGFDEHLLYEADASTVREEVKRCLDAAMEGGGYVLRSTGQIFDAKPGLIEVMCETAHDLGRY